ncbi:esterase [Methylomonas methanica]|uniref:Esterase/lipase/thioesterase family lipase n=1 Tax=Methylomonas methanica (strain DSM 25384 / MC09) TaxID=857087 RepID=G0A6Q6_METMM|nr:esterase [Methylomonas methanica]AEG00527.1 esterase/lipase/thioesterase family lipase [Methylomonas methanica MC09]
MKAIKMHPLQVFIIAASLLSGCASNEIYRSDYRPCDVSAGNACELNSQHNYNIGADDEYTLGFVEIDDQGQMRDRKQMQALLDTLYQKAAQESILLTVFVHGWHHNARPGDTNIESFKENLARISKIESRRAKELGRPPRKIAGVYIGWRGESIDVPPFNYLTFWDRKSTAQDVGYLGITELLIKLEEIANVRNSMTPPIKSRLVVIGHSFGGAVVFSATSQILASRFIDSRENKGFTDTAKGFGDLVVLLNPAFEALRYSPFYDLAQARCSYFPEQVPRLAILTSEADDATGILFPMGRVFSTVFETHHDIERNECNHSLSLDEGAADRNTVGHYEPLISHTLTPVTEEKNLQLANYKNVKHIWSTQTPGNVTQYGSTVLTHLNNTNPRNPYLNIRVDEAIIADHNDVFNEKVMEFIRLLIGLSTED